MATVKSHSDLQQSKKLAEILPIESADMVYVHTVDLEGDEHYDIDFRNNQPLFDDDICAWSLAVLLDILQYPTLFQNGDKEWGCTVWIDTTKPYSISPKDNPVDACYELVLKLHELKML